MTKPNLTRREEPARLTRRQPTGNRRFSPSLFFLSLPLVGLWLYLFAERLRKQEQSREMVLLHALILGYFLFSQCFLFLSIWIVPYFVEPVVMAMIMANNVFSIFLFCRLMAVSLGLPWEVFPRYRFLSLIFDWVYPSEE